MYTFFDSECWDRHTENPKGFLEPQLSLHVPNRMLILSRLGMRVDAGEMQLEVGGKLFWPINLDDPKRQLVFEKGGGFDRLGRPFGGVALDRMFVTYLQGTY